MYLKSGKKNVAGSGDNYLKKENLEDESTFKYLKDFSKVVSGGIFHFGYKDI